MYSAKESITKISEVKLRLKFRRQKLETSIRAKFLIM